MQKTRQIYKILMYHSIEIAYYYRMVKKYICNIKLIYKAINSLFPFLNIF